MSRRSLYTSSRPAPLNIGILLRRPFQAIVDAIDARLAANGFDEIRPAHHNVFQFIEPEGTRVTVLADRAQMSKQSMAELVAHLEDHGYAERVPDPSDRRAKLVRLTDRGRATVPVALEAIRETAAGWRKEVGAERFDALVKGLEALNREL
jgi:DNA-binding MarR family transcriptional regulator